MADLNMFLRSKDRIRVVLQQVTRQNTHDEQTDHYVSDLQKAIQVIDVKINQLKRRKTRY